MPQEASLFPNLSVGGNIGFGIPRGWQRAARTAEFAALVGLGDHVDRSPGQLSGGQAQRVSLARALAPRPDVVLLDEPFAALDPMLRTSLRADVSDLLRKQQSTAVLVTHDQEEALSLADTIAVMMAGRIVQWGSPLEVYEQPTTPWVARFVGDTVEFRGVWRDGFAECPLGRIEAVAMDDLHAGDAVRVVLRPEWVSLVPGGADAEVVAVSYAGHDALVTLTSTSGDRISSRVAAPDIPAPGDWVGLRLRRRALVYR